MTDIRLRSVSRTQGNNRALKAGEIQTSGYRLDFEEVPVLVDAFRRMVRGNEFDVCEMAITTYLCAKAYGKPFTALPIFLVRAFHHGAVLTVGETTAKDLEGARVGVNRGYTVTTGVWARGVLRDEHGVDPNSVTWVLSGDEHVAKYRPPTNVVPVEGGAKLSDLLRNGDLAAAIGIESTDPAIHELIPDAEQAGYDGLARRGHYPINHLVVVRDELLHEHPDLAPLLFEAFRASKADYVEKLRSETITNPTATDKMHSRVMEITGADPLPYGIEPNRGVIDELIGHALDQKIIGVAPDVDELFAEGTRDLVG